MLFPRSRQSPDTSCWTTVDEPARILSVGAPAASIPIHLNDRRLMAGFPLLCATGFVAIPYDRMVRKTVPCVMSYCPKCGKSLEHDRRSHTGVCTTCGTAVMMPSKSTGVASFTRPEASGRLGDNFCLRCGQRIRGNSRFCSSCSQVRSQEIPTIY